ncbi:LytR family transcriptional attenuator [Leucobacter komagatae]|uniref:LytR family transcriptional attenuator n=1 Tax=Leucobacter komagatae TaxID=55969 RepID=A0A542Y912_9MICO|nr:LCP family protein [Leucobacter komagatae]TQL44484.1 LytR family transcriptional attenuator [Leucobacter komagatae]
MGDNLTEFEKMLSEASEDAKNAPPKKRHGLRNTLIVIGSILALIGIGAGVAYAMLNSAYNKIERVETVDPNLERPAAVEPPAGKNAPINVLLLGSDSRDTTDPNAKAEDLKGFRSDAIMVAQISPNRDHVTVMSIMRDNWVQIQGHGEAKINAAVAFGGIPLAVNTVENFIDARIDHVALIDFDSFKGLTDAVGGVTVDNPIAFTSHHGSFDFPQGKITLNGEEALGFVRERYAFTDGDYQRARNQQIYLKGLLSQMLSKETLTNPGKISGTFDALSPYLIVDQDLTLTTAAGLGYDMRNIRKGDISFFTSPTLGTGTSGDGQSIVLPDWTEIEVLRAAMRDGTLDHYASTRQAG